MNATREERARLAAFDAVRRAQASVGEVLHVDHIPDVHLDGERIPLFSLQSGIHKPAALEACLCVTTTPPKPGREAPYEDRFGDDGLFRYAYRTARTPTARARALADADNRSVRAAMQARLPIIYWFGVVPGRYRPFFPVYVADDDVAGRTFGLDLTELAQQPGELMAAEPMERAYRTAIVRARMHQARFREAVLRAYRSACAVCRLRLPRLVEAAHIVADADGGTPAVPNGLALCKIHHAAFDAHILGVRPDLVVVINREVLEQVDGPMLRHGLQEFHDQRLLQLPSRIADRPAAEALERRWSAFNEAG